jgi:phage tail sheath protein FI
MAEKIISPDVFTRESDKSIVRRGTTEAGAALIGPTVKGTPLSPTYVTSYSEYESVFGSTFKSGSYAYEYFTSLAAREYFNSGGRSLLVTRIISGSSNVNVYSSASIQTSGSAATASFELEALAWGDVSNNSGSVLSTGALVSGSKDNVRWEVSQADYTKGTFTVVIRRGDDTTTNKNVLETFSNVSLDPQQSNYISRVIGDKKKVYTIDSDGNAFVYESGSYSNASDYVRIKTVIPQINSLDNNGNFLSGSYASTMPAVGSGSLNGAFTGGVAATNLSQKLFENSSTGNSSSNNIQGFQASDYQAAITLLGNKAEYDFNLIVAPGVSLNSNAVSNLISLCDDVRTDCMAILDTQEFGGTVTGATSAAAASNSNYAAAYWPWVQVYSSNLGKAVWAPASVVMLGVYAFNDQVSAEWFAPAGLNRGGIGSVIQAERKLSRSNIDTLYSSNINALATFPGEGVVAWGQKTLQKRATALDRVGVRRLLINLKRYISQVSRTLVFEQNTITTRNLFLSRVNPYLEQVVQKQGLYAFRVVMDDSNNTADVIDRNQLVGQIQLQPTKTAEFIILDFNILPTGASFDV